MTIKDLEKELKQEARDEIADGIEMHMMKLYNNGDTIEARAIEVVLNMIESQEIQTNRTPIQLALHRLVKPLRCVIPHTYEVHFTQNHPFIELDRCHIQML